MHAAFITQTGPPDLLQYGELPDPEVGPRDVLVRVGAVSVNPIDTYIRAGAIKMDLAFPYIPGCDLAGTVVACGAEATRFRPGDRVWGSNQGLFGRRGSFAELAAVNEDWLYPTPSSESDSEAAAGALVGITAHLGLFRIAELQPGDVLFVNGGSGGVGSCVVQLAKAAGAKVITTAGNDEKRQACLALGADVALDYKSPTLDDDIRAAAADRSGVDVWFETQREPTLERTIGLMRKRGRIVLMAGRDAKPTFTLGAFYTNDLSLRGFAMFNATPDEQRAAADDLNRWLSEGKWKPQVGKTFNLSEAAAAHRLQEENTLGKAGTLSGKIVLTP